MEENSNKFETLMAEHEMLKQIQSQLFENMKVLLESDKHRLDKEDTVIKNQGMIIKNQEVIVKNQVNIINNQKLIAQNQVTLNVIFQTQARVINMLKKMDGNDEDLDTTIKMLNEVNAQIVSENSTRPLNDPNLI